jgi:hypothetical protein
MAFHLDHGGRILAGLCRPAAATRFAVRMFAFIAKDLWLILMGHGADPRLGDMA